MKLIIQIPCYNEESTLPQVVRDLPKHIQGVDVIELQVVDDGSTDRTVEIARELGVHHIVSFKKNRGLAAAFRAGMENALKEQADILVNTDGDNQYCGQDIPKLVAPILAGEADLVMGCRSIDDHPEFSLVKKMLQKLGSWVIRKASMTSVKDATSGFRAYSRDTLMHLNIVSSFSYCLESLIQAGVYNLKVVSVDISVNSATRRSRLFRNIPHYLYHSMKTIVMVFILYRSNVFFGTIALITSAIAVILALRFTVLVLFFDRVGKDFWPSIVLSGALLGVAVQVYFSGILASLLSANRKINEEILYHLRRSAFSNTVNTDKDAR